MTIRLSHLELAVTDIEASVRFALDICGLRLTEETDGAFFLTTGERHHELVLHPDGRAACRQVGFELTDASELEALRRRVRSAGSEIIELGDHRKVGVEDAFLFPGPDGQLFEALTGMHGTTDDRPADPLRPLTFGHVSVKSENPRRLVSFLVGVIGLRLSDRVGGQAMWLRADRQHHGVAIMTEPPGIHHYAFEIRDWTSFGLVADHLLAHGHTLIWGPGRHGPGNNLFAYFLDPAGCVVEYYAELNRIDDEEHYEPGDWPATPDTFNLWGPRPPAGWHDHGLPYQSP